jgi:hypothetical protein
MEEVYREDQKMGSIIRMYATTAGGTENGLAAVDIPMNTSLVGVQWACVADLDADDEYWYGQLSFSSAYANTNDQRSAITECRMKMALTTSGVWVGYQNLYCPMPNLALNAGERLYLHCASSAGVIGIVNAFLAIADDLDRPSVRRR